MLREKEFNPSTDLWPPCTVDGGTVEGVAQPPFVAQYHSSWEGERKALEANGLAPGLGDGSLLVVGGVWMIVRTGGAGLGFWLEPFDRNNSNHVAAANRCQRYGAGAAKGDPEGADGRPWLAYHRDLYGHDPGEETSMEFQDFIYDAGPGGRRERERAAWNERFHFTPGRPDTAPGGSVPTKPGSSGGGSGTPVTMGPTAKEKAYDSLLLDLDSLILNQKWKRGGGVPNQNWAKMIEDLKAAVGRARKAAL